MQIIFLPLDDSSLGSKNIKILNIFLINQIEEWHFFKDSLQHDSYTVPPSSTTYFFEK